MSAADHQRPVLSHVLVSSGELPSNKRPICFMVVLPNYRHCHHMSSRDRRGPGPDLPKGENQ
jgi:hypothetical protein